MEQTPSAEPGVDWSPDAPPPEATPAALTIDLKALQENYRTLRAESAPATCAGVVKGDGYGTGLVSAARAMEAAGCAVFFVAVPAEGHALRRALPEAAIYVLDGLLPGAARDYAALSLRPVLGSPEEIAEWAQACRATGRHLPAAIHVDTGINRLGLTPDQVDRLAGDPRDLDAIQIDLVMSHLACADAPNNPMNAAQVERFDALRARLPAAPASLANSSGTLNGAAYHYDLVRPGVALYGGNPFSGRANPMKPVVHLHGTILQVRSVPAGDSVGYGATWRAPRDSLVAVIGVGYCDGYFRALGGHGGGVEESAQVYIAGQFAPVVGRVSMDMITVDITDLARDTVRRGTKAELIGSHVTVDDIAHWAGTIPYEVLTGLGSRYARIYSDYERN